MPRCWWRAGACLCTARWVGKERLALVGGWAGWVPAELHPPLLPAAVPCFVQVLSVQSGVLRALFADLHSSEESAGTRSRWRRLLLGSEVRVGLQE